MTNRISIWLGAALLGLVALDFVFFNWDGSLFLGRKLLELIEYLAFWR